MNYPDIMKVKRAFTHNGVFHADDVFSSAFLLLLNPEIRIERGNTVPVQYDGIVFDIGSGQFDHHQADRRVRANGIPYAAFGLLWEAYGRLVLEDEDARNFDGSFIQPLDESDNTGKYHVLAQCVSEWNPQWNESHADEAEGFEGAVAWARQLLEVKFRAIRAQREAFVQVRICTKKQTGPILWLHEAMPWKEAVQGTEFLYVCFPSVRGGYVIQAVPKDGSELKLKKPFPTEWRGKTSEELRRLTGIETFTFCHNSGFLCVAEKREDAAMVAREAVEYTTY